MGGPWTHFWDMHSGGRKKESFGHIYIEAPADEAKVIFYNRFGHNSERVTCTCCGGDYSISESPTLEEASGYQRGCDYAWFLPDGAEYQGNDPRADYGTSGTYREALDAGLKQRIVERPDTSNMGVKPYRTVEQYALDPDVLIIPASDISPESRRGAVPEQGYVWVGDS